MKPTALLRSSAAFLCILYVCVSTFAQQRPQGIHSSYVSIEMKTDTLDSQPTTNTICGGVVANVALKLIATAWHCVPNQRSIIEKPGIFSINGMNAKFITFSAEGDVALFKVDDLKGLKAPQFKIPKKGDIIVASAYYNEFPVFTGSGDRFTPLMSIRVVLDWEGEVSVVANANRRGGEQFDKVTATEFEWIVAKGISAPGFSGGPVFDKSGNFIGLISSTNGGFTTISSSKNVTMLIKKLLP